MYSRNMMIENQELSMAGVRCQYVDVRCNMTDVG